MEAIGAPNASGSLEGMVTDLKTSTLRWRQDQLRDSGWDDPYIAILTRLAQLKVNLERVEDDSTYEETRGWDRYCEGVESALFQLAEIHRGLSPASAIKLVSEQCPVLMDAIKYDERRRAGGASS